MHDTAWFEIQGLPAVFVASHTFADAAQAQSTALGLAELRWCLVPHPIQDATDEEVRAKADAVVDEVLRALSEAPDAGG